MPIPSSLRSLTRFHQRRTGREHQAPSQCTHCTRRAAGSPHDAAARLCKRSVIGKPNFDAATKTLLGDGEKISFAQRSMNCIKSEPFVVRTAVIPLSWTSLAYHMLGVRHRSLHAYLKPGMSKFLVPLQRVSSLLLACNTVQVRPRS